GIPPNGGATPDGGFVPNGGIAPNGGIPPNGGMPPNNTVLLPNGTVLTPAGVYIPNGGYVPNGGTPPNNSGSVLKPPPPRGSMLEDLQNDPLLAKVLLPPGRSLHNMASAARNVRGSGFNHQFVRPFAHPAALTVPMVRR